MVLEQPCLLRNANDKRRCVRDVAVDHWDRDCYLLFLSELSDRTIHDRSTVLPGPLLN